MRYTFLFCTKCGANSVNPGKARSGSHARNPTPRRLRVFCSTAAIILSDPITTLAPRTAKPVSSVRRWRELGSWLIMGWPVTATPRAAHSDLTFADRAAARLPDRASSSEAGLAMLQSPARAQRINFRPSLRNSYELRANAGALDVTATCSILCRLKSDTPEVREVPIGDTA